MKKTKSRTYQSLSFAALLLGSASLLSAQIADNNLNSFDSTAQLAPNGSPPGYSPNNSTYGGGIWYGSSTVTWDGTQDNSGNGGGSAHIVSTWGLGQANSDSPFEVYLGSPSDQLYYIPAPVALSQYLNVQFDFKWDNSSTMALDWFNNMSLVPTNYLVNPNTPLNNAGRLEVDGAKNGSGSFIGSITVPSAATNGWVHFNFTINPSTANLDGSMGILLRPAGYFSTSGNLASNITAKFWIDNIFLKGTAAPPPPPALTIAKATQGLNFIQGSISGEFDRQNIITTKGANSTANYSWAGVATGANPVTYSFNINKFDAPDLNYHIYLYQTAGAGGASAPDYNQPNVVIFQVSPGANNSAVATLSWKTNSPNSGTISNALFGSSTTITNSSRVGNWQLQFTSDVGGVVIGPGAVSYPFTINPGVAAALANPITVNFGINPAANTNSILGETVVVSKIEITGVDLLSDTSTSENFLTDTVLDPGAFTVNAHNSASIVLVPTNTPYAVSWTLPDNGFGLLVSSNLNLAAATSVTQSVLTLPPGREVFVSQDSLPAGNAAFFSLIKRTFTQLQVLLPGETAAPNTPSGKTGTPTPVNAGDLVTVTIRSVDATWNLVNASDTVHLTSTDGTAITPNDTGLVNGTLNAVIQFNSSGSWTVTASDVFDNTKTPNTSSAITVN